MTQLQSAARHGGIKLQLAPLERIKPLTPEAQAKGEAFIQAMLDDGLDFPSMKAGFLRCMVLRCVKQTRGTVARGAMLINTTRDTFVLFVRKLRLQKDIDDIRAAAGAPLPRFPRVRRSEGAQK